MELAKGKKAVERRTGAAKVSVEELATGERKKLEKCSAGGAEMPSMERCSGSFHSAPSLTAHEPGRLMPPLT